MGRTRTRSRNDSGCDEGFDTPDWTSSLLEETIQTWVARLEGVVRQEAERVREATDHTKNELRNAQEDDNMREMALNKWKRQVLEGIELLTDLVECVNNDTKEVICDTVGRCSSGHTSSPLDGIDEGDEEKMKEKNEEIMKLFLLSTNREKKVKEVRKKNRKQPKKSTSKKQNGKRIKKVRKGGKDVQDAWTKLKKEEVIQKRKDSQQKRISTSDIFEDAMYGMKMFQSVIDPEDFFEEWNWNMDEPVVIEEMFEDWRWNFEEDEDYADIFQDWKWNMELQDQLKTKFYNTSGVNEDWNDWKFWGFVERSMAEIESDDDIDCVLKIQADDWKDWHYWDNWDNWESNKEILKALEATTETGPEIEINFWEDSDTNINIMNALVDDIDTGNLADTEDENESKRKNDAWEKWLFWDKTGTNEDILKELIEFTDMCDEGLNVYDGPLGFWDESNENKNIIEGLVDRADKRDVWQNWDFWNEFGQVDDILNAYEEVLRANKPKSPMSLSNLCKKKVSEYSAEDIFNDWNDNLKERQVVRRLYRKKKQQQDIDKIFWQISLENDGSQGEHRRLSEEIQNLPVWESPDVFNDYSDLFDSTVKYYKPNQRPKDPVNIFKSWRNIFDEPIVVSNKKNKPSEDSNAYLLDDMEDVYGDWASVTLSDVRTEKKRRTRGSMKKIKNPPTTNQVTERKKLARQEDNRKKTVRPGTPTITTVAIKSSFMDIFEYNSSQRESAVKNPKKEKKTVHVWKNARSQKRLQAKLFAKQPRPRM